jgi:hypothetical protein
MKSKGCGRKWPGYILRSYSTICLDLLIPRLCNDPCYVGHCHHDMARHRAAVGRDVLQICTVAANRLNKQSRTADKVWACSLGVGRGANNSSPLNNQLITKCYIGTLTWTHNLERPR